jgi:hypothetical protein
LSTVVRIAVLNRERDPAATRPIWNVDQPPPIVLMRSEDGATWRVSDTHIEDDGKVKSAPGRTLVWHW